MQNAKIFKLFSAWSEIWKFWEIFPGLEYILEIWIFYLEKYWILK